MSLTKITALVEAWLVCSRTGTWSMMIDRRNWGEECGLYKGGLNNTSAKTEWGDSPDPELYGCEVIMIVYRRSWASHYALDFTCLMSIIHGAWTHSSGLFFA